MPSNDTITNQSPSSSPRRERLEARLSPAQKALIQRGADLTGRSLTDFVVASAQAAAEQAIREHEIMRLSEADSLLFANALLNPPGPNDRLRDAARRYRAFAGE